MPEPKITEKTAFRLIGCSFYGNPFVTASEWSEDNGIGLLWKRFFREYQHHREFLDPLRTDDTWLEVHLMNPDSEEQGLFEVFVGIPVSSLDAIPTAMVGKTLPSVRYAVFTRYGEAIFGDCRDEALSLGAAVRSDYGFQRYDERFKGMDRISESALDFYYPLNDDAGI